MSQPLRRARTIVGLPRLAVLVRVRHDSDTGTHSPRVKGATRGTSRADRLRVMLTTPREGPMSGSITPGPPAGGLRRGALARFWLLIGLSCVWTSGNIGMPGRRRRQGASAKCPRCCALALRQVDGSYKCPNGHIFRKKTGRARRAK